MGRCFLSLFTLLALTACDPGPEEVSLSSETVTLLIEERGWGDVSPSSGSMALGSVVTLEATPHQGWFFQGWSGDAASSDNPLTLTLDGDTSVVATFYQPTPYDNWNGTAVRKVLQTFAWGGFATDDQIALWAAMPPEAAIEEMLTFEPTNDKLSPPDVDDLGAAIQDYIPEGAGQLEGITRYFATDPDDLIAPEREVAFDIEGYPAPAYAWDIAGRARGLNTFYHRIGFYETNYHMATNQRAGVAPHPMIRHYDNIMGKLSAGAPYHEVIAQGALNSAVAYQYGHNFNAWVLNEASGEMEFRGNEDFAREFHQLFFGILGEVAFGGEEYHENHELVSIRNTAKALTGMSAYYRVNGEINLLPTGEPDVVVDFDVEIDQHHQPGLTILDTVINGYSAREKIAALAEVAVDHPESLKNLPVILIAGLADDKLTEEKKEAIRELWAGPTDRTLLDFIRAYAISDLFLSSDRVKYQSSFDRNLFIHNRMQLGNHELYEDQLGQHPLYVVWEREQIEPFNPVHNVFGQQTSVEAFNDPEVFKNAYNQSTEDVDYYETGFASDRWKAKDWQHTIAPDGDGLWVVKDVARFLWQRFIADGLKNFGPLEAAHLYALLGSDSDDLGMQGLDLGLYLDPDDPERVYSSAELQSEPLLSKIVALSQRTMALGSSNDIERARANACVQRAIAFISATPYAFLQEGL